MSIAAREFNLQDREFQFIARLIREQAGIVIGDNKRELVYSRITRRLRELKLDSFRDYCRLLRDEQSGTVEMKHFINALTTNLTAFFRENHHFEYIEKELLPKLLKAKTDKRLRIWSAGCSSGEEAYSIAMIVAESVPSNWDARILATELDSNILQEAETAIYPISRVERMPEARLRRWFKRGTGQNEGMVRVAPELCSLISFRQLNLLHQWPFQGQFDIIFCRNVVIYFDTETQINLFDRFANNLTPNGHLFVGHSESLYQKTERFALIGNTVYQRTH